MEQPWDSLKRLDEVIFAPRVEHSLEWGIDSCDVILIATIGRVKTEVTVTELLKSTDSAGANWPPGDARRDQAVMSIFQPGDRILFFLRIDRETQKSGIYSYYPLVASSDPRRSKSQNQFYGELPAEMDSRMKMYLVRRHVFAGFNYLAIDKLGKVIRDPDDLLERVKARIASGSRIPAGCDREAVEQRKSVIGGFYTSVTLDSEYTAQEFPTILVPPDPEFRVLYVPKKDDAMPQLDDRLVNYQDDDVTALLKQLLTNNTLIEATRIRKSDGQRQGSTRQTVRPGEPPMKLEGEAEGIVKVERIFYYRKRAYELLTQMGVKVEKPNWTVE